MTDFIITHPWSLCMAWVLACYAVIMSMFILSGRRDDEAEKMGRIRRVK